MIRPYKDEDLEPLLEAWYSASRVGHPFLDEAFLERERQTIREVHLPRAETWVYEMDGEIAGFIALVGNEVGAVFVDARHQRRGIGRALMDKAREIREVLELDVFMDNRVGRAFYEKYGFRPVGESIHPDTGLVQLRLRLTF